MARQFKSEAVSFRMTGYERLLAEAIASKRDQLREEPYSLSDLIRDALLREIRADVTKETNQ